MDINSIFEAQRRASRAEDTPSLAVRRKWLTELIRLVHEHQDSLAETVSADFGHRSRHEFLITEIYTTIKAIKHMRRHLRRWMRTRRVPVSLEMLPGRASVMYQPLGVIGIISPWNYPLYLTFLPLANALAAGNRVMIKPSEHSPLMSAKMRELLGGVFGEEQVAVATGGVEVAREFSALPFDHLLYTGSTSVGRQVMRAASENLTPVTLELGGKSPAIIGEGANVRNAARSIIAGKLINAGQTCIATDYVLLPASSQEEFVTQAKEIVGRLFPDIQSNQDYTAINNDGHYARIQQHLADARAKGAEIIEISPGSPVDPVDAGVDSGAGSNGGAGGTMGNGAARKIAPNLLLGVTDDMTVMQEEIFGPLLPLVTYNSIDEAIDYVNARDRPLALYYFGQNRAEQKRVLARTVSGGVTVNDTLFHIAVDGLHFGGVGASGMGAYQGFTGFETFSMKKPIFHQSRINGTALFHPPYGKLTERVVRLLVGRGR